MNALDVFREDRIAAACEKCGVEGAMREAVLDGVREINASPEQRNSAWQYYEMLFLSGKDQVSEAGRWPIPPRDSSLGPRLMYAVVCLAGLPEIRKAHAARRIPEEITWRTMSDVPVWLQDSRKFTSDWVFEKINVSLDAAAVPLQRYANKFAAERTTINQHAWSHNQALAGSIARIARTAARLVPEDIQRNMKRRAEAYIREKARGRYTESNRRVSDLTGLSLSALGYDVLQVGGQG